VKVSVDIENVQILVHLAPGPIVRMWPRHPTRAVHFQVALPSRGNAVESGHGNHLRQLFRGAYYCAP
jgi:hypothetical protein